MTTSSAPVTAQSEVKATLLAYLDALVLAEPIQARLWQLAEITLTQASALRELRAGPQTSGRLGQAVGMSPPSLSHLVDRLEKRGLVSRRRDAEDRRRVDVHLEPAGERVLGETKVFRGSDLHLAVEAMTSEERRRLISALTRLVELAHGIALEREERL